jgi:hypothetical protein
MGMNQLIGGWVKANKWHGVYPGRIQFEYATLLGSARWYSGSVKIIDTVSLLSAIFSVH